MTYCRQLPVIRPSPRAIQVKQRWVPSYHAIHSEISLGGKFSCNEWQNYTRWRERCKSRPYNHCIKVNHKSPCFARGPGGRETRTYFRNTVSGDEKIYMYLILVQAEESGHKVARKKQATYFVAVHDRQSCKITNLFGGGYILYIYNVPTATIFQQ